MLFVKEPDSGARETVIIKFLREWRAVSSYNVDYLATVMNGITCAHLIRLGEEAFGIASNKTTEQSITDGNHSRQCLESSVQHQSYSKTTR